MRPQSLPELKNRLNAPTQLASDCYYPGLEQDISHKIMAVFDRRVDEEVLYRGRPTTMRELRINVATRGLPLGENDNLLAISRTVGHAITEVLNAIEKITATN